MGTAVSTLVRRLGQSALVLLIMSFVIYALIGLMPGDPVDLMIATTPGMTAEDANRLKALHGIGRPVIERWWDWLTAAATGDFGVSRLYATPVGDILGLPLLRSLGLIGLSLLTAMIVAVPLGVLAALRPRSWPDYTINLIAFTGMSMPVFWLGIMLIVIFAVVLGWLPAGGIPASGSGWGGTLQHMVLPVATLATATVGQYTRYMRAATIEALRQDWVRTALAKGASRRRVIFGHVLRAALLPVITVLALDFGALFSGALITETVFATPGMGKLIFDAVMGNDYALALAALLLATAVTLIGNALADVSYGLLDPRTRRP